MPPKYAPKLVVDLKHGAPDSEPEETIKPLEIWEVAQRDQDIAQAVEVEQVAVEKGARKEKAREKLRTEAGKKGSALAPIADAILELLEP